MSNQGELTMPETIAVTCPECGMRAPLPLAHVGKSIICKKCGGTSCAAGAEFGPG